MNTKGIEFSFGWMFAIIVGAAILALGLFAASKILQQGQYQGDSLAAREFGILTTALETSSEASKVDKITFDVPSRLLLECDSSGIYGTQKITTGDADKEATGIKAAFPGKYFFAEKEMQGREFVVLSKPFNYPFPVANILILWPRESFTCFLDPPEQLERELRSLMRDNAFVNASLQVLTYDKKENCRRSSKKVCFGKTTGCDIVVGEASIRKNGATLFFDPAESNNALLLAGIFSDPQTYECQAQRLMHRGSTLAELYQEKTLLLNGKGCTSSLTGSLQTYAQLAKSFKSSREFAQASLITQQLGGENERLSCPVF